MEVTVTVPTLNEKEYIEDCLDDIEKAKSFCDHEVEVIVVDSNSTDGTQSIVWEHSTVDKMKISSKKGILKARDMGIREASGDIVVCIDADTRYPEDFIQKLIEPFEKNSDTVISYGRAKGLKTEFHIDSFMRMILQNGLHVIDLAWVNGSNRAIDREKYMELGGYNLDRDSDSLMTVMFEEQVWFPLKMKDVGEMKFVPEAESFQSHRSVDQLLLLDRKNGGRSWNFINHFGIFDIFRKND